MKNAPCEIICVMSYLANISIRQARKKKKKDRKKERIGNYFPRKKRPFWNEWSSKTTKNIGNLIWVLKG